MSALVDEVRRAIHDAIQRSVDVRGETFCEITEDVWLVDGGVNLQWLAEAAVGVLSGRRFHGVTDTTEDK